MSVLKKIGIGVGVFLTALYVLFLVVPLFLNGIVNSYSDDIAKIVEKSSGFKIKLEKIQILTTPKLTAGIKIGHADLMLPTGESFLKADNFKVKLSLLPVFIKKIEVDMVSVDKIEANLKVQKDGKFLIEKFIPETVETEAKQPQAPITIPFGIKLSNHLPDVIVKNYNIAFIDISTDKIYSITGDKAKVTDFILNKKIKVALSGKATLDNRTQFNYDLKLLNKIMPDVQLNDLVFAPQTPEDTEKPQVGMVNVIDIFKAIYNNQLTADVVADVKTSGNLEDIKFDGFLNVDKLTLAVDGKKLPDGKITMDFKGNKIVMDTKLYSAVDEVTSIIGDFKTGKRAKIDLTCKSNAKFASIFDILDSLAKSFGHNELSTLTATGAIDADFNLKSNLKKIHSSGHFNVVSADILYKLYNVSVNNINANIDLSNNQINIKKAGFSIMGQPLNITGTISNSAVADLHVLADRLQLKGLLVAAGQMGMLKDNDFRSGTLSLDASLEGKLNKPNPKVNLSVDNVNVKNMPSSTTVTMTNTKVKLTTDGKKTGGNINLSQMRIVNPMAVISVPNAVVALGEKDIVIDKTYLLFNNSKINISGKIADYMTKKINFDIKANGGILANDIRTLIPSDMRKGIVAKGSLPLTASITGDDKAQEINFKLTANPTNYVNIMDVDAITGQTLVLTSNIKILGDKVKLSNTGAFANSVSNPLVLVGGSVNNIYSVPKLALNISTPKQLGFAIPGFKKSKVLAKADVNASGFINNPKLTGNVVVPKVAIPEMLIAIDGLNVNLAGPIVKGTGTVKKFKSGGIVAENINAGFGLKGNNFYLNGINGDAFLGKINGNVNYNIANGNIGVDFKGAGMDAASAIEGAAGIKNALSGKLGFAAKINLSGATEKEMMQSLKGKVTFKIEDGTLGNIGRFENMLFADNIMANGIMKAAITPITKLPAIKDTSVFKYISGDLTFNNGWAKLNPIKMSGNSMSYYITGRYNLLNGTANVIILGRLSAQVVALLGPVGDLSVDKLTSYIPKFGALTGAIIKTMTTNPRGENTAAIPQLASGNKNFKDFKVSFNGGVESRSSVKSFKWLSTCDTSAVEKVNIKQQFKDTTKAIQDARETARTDGRNALEDARKRAQESRQRMLDAKKNMSNLKNLLH